MKAERRKSNAVAESREWKEAVAKETEGMTPEETMACFDRAAVRSFDTLTTSNRADTFDAGIGWPSDRW